MERTELRAACDKWAVSMPDATKTKMWERWVSRRPQTACSICRCSHVEKHNPMISLCDCELRQAHLECILSKYTILTCERCNTKLEIRLPFDPKQYLRINCDIDLTHVKLLSGVALNYGGTIFIVAKREIGQMCVCVVPKQKRWLYCIYVDTGLVRRFTL